MCRQTVNWCVKALDKQGSAAVFWRQLLKERSFDTHHKGPRCANDEIWNKKLVRLVSGNLWLYARERDRSGGARIEILEPSNKAALEVCTNGHPRVGCRRRVWDDEEEEDAPGMSWGAPREKHGQCLECQKRTIKANCAVVSSCNEVVVDGIDEIYRSLI